MSYVWLTWLAEELRGEGCVVIEESGWKTRGRPSSSGSFNPIGVTDHHTGTTTSNQNPHPTLNTCINGRTGLPGPLCQVLICYSGHCHVIAAGRANHAGRSNGWGPYSAGDGNAQSIGFEIDYDGTQKPSSAQMEAVHRANVAVLRKLGKPAGNLCGHSESSVTGKWDPGIAGKPVNMALWRAEAAKRLGQKPPTPKPPPPAQGDYTGEVVANAQDVWTIKPWGSADPVSTASALQRVFQMVEEMDSGVDEKVWTSKPWSSSDPVSAASALQRIFQMVEDIQKDVDAIKAKLEI